MVKAAYYNPAAWIEVSGEDAADFLQSQFSNDLGGADGAAVYGLWLDVRGRILADSFVLRHSPERFTVFSYFSPAGTITGTLERHIIADDVECETAGAAGFSVIGDGAGGLLGALGVPRPEPGTFAAEGDVVVLAGRRSREPSFEVLFRGPRFPEDFAGRVKELERSGAAEAVSEIQLQAERVAAGIVAVPVDAGPADLPGECGLDASAVSFAKGCFLGQEVVARMRHVGRPRRGLHRVSGSGRSPAVPATIVTGEGKVAGRVTTAVQSSDGWTGLGILKFLQADGAGALSVAGAKVDVHAVETRNIA